MKYIYKIFMVLLAVGMMASCESEDDYVPPYNDVSSLTFWSSPSFTALETEKEINVNDYIAFKDISRGVLSHEWRIQSNAKFLQKNIPETDTIYANYILPDAGQTSSDDLINVFFPEVGTSEVRLINTFKDSVTDAVFEDGVWKVDKLFTITVNE